MKNIIRLSETDLTRLIKNILNESDGPNKKGFDACVASYVKPQNEDLETFFKRPELKNTCSAIRSNLNAYDNLFMDNKYIKDGPTKINILTNCFYGVKENQNQKQGTVDDQGNIIEKGDDRYWSFIECVKTNN
jgi:hypothetical protein